MTVYNLGSINIDHVYSVPHLPAPGETLAAVGHAMGLGGKGANQSVAAARTGARCVHVGAVGPDGDWALGQIAGHGVDVSHISRAGAPTGHAVIYVETGEGAENSIVLLPGANWDFDRAAIEVALAGACAGDTLLLQNETAHQAFAAALGQEKGLRVIYSAAPFDIAAVQAVLPHVSVLAMNAVEAQQLCDALGCSLEDVPVPELLVTRGAEGAAWLSNATGAQATHPAFKVKAVDTTGAGDTFTGSFAAALDEGLTPAEALRLASATAALQVTRPGAAGAIPARAEVEAFLAAH